MTTIDLDIPVLETPRLILRGHRLADFEPYHAMVADPAIRRHFLPGPLSREDAWARFLRSFGYWAVLGYGTWAVEERATGAYAGVVGVFDAKRDIEPSIDGMPEAAWSLAARVHGKGYATEAVGAALAWTDRHLGGARICAIIAPQNIASIRVAEKTGFRPWQEATFKNKPSVIYVRDTP
jgi:RimJ/RimL family protein N-acetyltransferase